MTTHFNYIFCATCLVIMFFCKEIHASTLVKNGTFDTDISEWNVTGSCGAGAWDSFPEHTGGALAINCFSSTTIGTIRQCAALSSVESEVSFSTEISGNGAVGPVAFGLLAYSTTDCSGPSITVLDKNKAELAPEGDCCGDLWTRFSRANLALPASTQSMSVEITVKSPADIVIDNVRLHVGTFENDFEAGS